MSEKQDKAENLRASHGSLRALVYSEFVGVGAISPEIYKSMLSVVAEKLGREVDEAFMQEVREVLCDIPSPLD